MITRMKAFSNVALPGVAVFSMTGNPQRGVPQQVLVKVEPDGLIPLHAHESDARMFIVGGSAQVLSDDPSTNFKNVATGDCVFFQKERAHGFKAGLEGLLFVSENGGIVDAEGNWDLKF